MRLTIRSKVLRDKPKVNLERVSSAMFNSRFDVKGRKGKKYSFRRLAKGLDDSAPYQIFVREGIFDEFAQTGQLLQSDLAPFMRRLSQAQCQPKHLQPTPVIYVEDMLELWASVQQAEALLLNCFPTRELFRAVLRRRGLGYIAGVEAVL